MRPMKPPRHGYLEVLLMLAFILGAYVLAAYLDQQDAHFEQHHHATGENK